MLKRRLKADHTSINVQGVGIITNDNLTPELYSRLIAMNPALGSFFEEAEVQEPKPKERKQKEQKEAKSE